jgi:hypothetical protein
MPVAQKLRAYDNFAARTPEQHVSPISPIENVAAEDAFVAAEIDMQTAAVNAAVQNGPSREFQRRRGRLPYAAHRDWNAQRKRELQSLAIRPG